MFFSAGLVGFSSGLGVTTGAHRLFSHKAYKAPFITRLVLILFHTLAGQVSSVFGNFKRNFKNMMTRYVMHICTRRLAFSWETRPSPITRSSFAPVAISKQLNTKTTGFYRLTFTFANFNYREDRSG